MKEPSLATSDKILKKYSLNVANFRICGITELLFKAYFGKGCGSHTDAGNGKYKW